MGRGGGQNFIDESMGGGFTNMISISFSGVKMLWLLGALPPDPVTYHYFFHLSYPTFHYHHRKIKTWRDIHTLRCPQSDSFVAVHTVTWSYASADILKGLLCFQLQLYERSIYNTPHPTRNIIVPLYEIESYRYIMLKNLSYHIRLYCTLCSFL